MENVGQRLKDLRNDNDETQESMAEKIKVTRKQVQRWEAEESEMTIGKLFEICQTYKISSDYLLGLPKGLKWPR